MAGERGLDHLDRDQRALRALGFFVAILVGLPVILELFELSLVLGVGCVVALVILAGSLLRRRRRQRPAGTARAVGGPAREAAPPGGLDRPIATEHGRRTQGSPPSESASSFLPAVATVGLLALLGGFIALGLMGRPPASAVPAEAWKLPPPPGIPPAGTTALTGTASDGMPVVVWRTGEDIWARVDSGPTTDCSPRGGSLTSNFATMRAQLRGGRRFLSEGQITTTALAGRGLGERRVPKEVTIRMQGKLVAPNGARGTFQRRDVLREEGVPTLDCTRKVVWQVSSRP